MMRGVANRKKRKRTGVLRAGAVLAALLLLLAGLVVACRPLNTEVAPSGHHYDDAIWTNSLGMKFLHVPSRDDLLMSVYETRVQDFRAFIESSHHDASSGFYYYQNFSWKSGDKDWRDPGFDQTDTHPVVGISWSDAMAFCDWLTEEERKAGLITPRQSYRLPTDDEWTRSAYPFMAWPYPTNTANYHDTIAMDPYSFTSPVGSFPPNRNGFYDLAGNAWEFCLDRVGPQGDYRTIRGGSWQNWHTPFLGAKARGSCSVSVRISIYGFRVVLADADSRSAGKTGSTGATKPEPEKI